jgi:hypothetical protein
MVEPQFGQKWLSTFPPLAATRVNAFGIPETMTAAAG